MKYTAEELNTLSKDEIIGLMLDTQSQLSALDSKYSALSEQVSLLMQQKFGRKSEKDLVEDDGQITLACILNEAEALLDSCFIVPEPSAEEVVPDIPVKSRKPKRIGKRAEDLKDLSAEDHDHTLSDEELADLFPDGYKELPTEDYLRLRFIPAQFIAERHHVHVYAAKDSERIVKADRPSDLLRNSIVTPSLEAAVINAKFVNAVPYDRLSKEFERNGIHISSTNMAGWTIKCGEQYLSDVYEELKKHLLSVPVIQADETPVKVSKDGRKAGSNSYMWVYRTGCREDVPPVILYEYQRTRNASHPREFLSGYRGICVTDGYQVYHTLASEQEDLTIAGCWAHARRKFADAVKAAGNDPKVKETVAYKALQVIGAIYDADRKFPAGSPGPDILKNRRDKVKPLVEAFFVWLRAKQLEVSASSVTGKGISYCLNQEKYLKVFLDHADVPMDNNASERAIRPFCVGKHNWHLIDTVRGAKVSAMIYSIVETAKACGVKPYEYFTYLLTEIPAIPAELRPGQMHRLMPWSDELPENCIMKK